MRLIFGIPLRVGFSPPMRAASYARVAYTRVYTVYYYPILFTIIFIVAVSSTLSDVLHSYTTLSANDLVVHHIQKRSIHPTDICDHEKIIELSQLERCVKFKMYIYIYIYTSKCIYMNYY